MTKKKKKKKKTTKKKKKKKKKKTKKKILHSQSHLPRLANASGALAEKTAKTKDLPRRAAVCRIRA